MYLPLKQGFNTWEKNIWIKVHSTERYWWRNIWKSQTMLGQKWWKVGSCKNFESKHKSSDDWINVKYWDCSFIKTWRRTRERCSTCVLLKWCTLYKTWKRALSCWLYCTWILPKWRALWCCWINWSIWWEACSIHVKQDTQWSWILSWLRSFSQGSQTW